MKKLNDEQRNPLNHFNIFKILLQISNILCSCLYKKKQKVDVKHCLSFPEIKHSLKLMQQKIHGKWQSNYILTIELKNFQHCKGNPLIELHLRLQQNGWESRIDS